MTCRNRSVSNDDGDDDGDDGDDGTCCSNGNNTDNDDMATDTCSCYDDDNVNNLKLTEAKRLLTETHRLLQAILRHLSLL